VFHKCNIIAKDIRKHELPVTVGSCRTTALESDHLYANWRNAARALPALSTGPNTGVITTASESGLSLTLKEVSPGQIEIEIGEGGVIRNCRMSGATYNQTLGMKSFNDYSPNRCEIRVQGETYRVGGVGFVPYGSSQVPQNGELKLELQIAPESFGTRQFRLEFRGKRKGWLF